MEDALAPAILNKKSKLSSVLILVLMEDALAQKQYAPKIFRLIVS